MNIIEQLYLLYQERENRELTDYEKNYHNLKAEYEKTLNEENLILFDKMMEEQSLAAGEEVFQAFKFAFSLGLHLSKEAADTIKDSDFNTEI